MAARVVAVEEEVKVVVAVAARHLHGFAQPLGKAILHSHRARVGEQVAEVAVGERLGRELELDAL